jgi:DnaJ-class molecular chaperone
MDNKENYYELLKVSPKASVSEIVSAYHAAKNAFSSDSIASYSLLDSEESKEIIKKIEEAFSVLSNIEKRRLYDMASNTQKEVETEIKSTQEAVAHPASNFHVEASSYEEISGGVLKDIREKSGYSVDDVARITKIPGRFIKAIESNQPQKLPAVVYLQGFIKNLSSLYKIDPQKTAASYLKFQHKITSEMVIPEKK